MREIVAHKFNVANAELHLQANDGPGPGGASHEYFVQLPDGSGYAINFQKGPIKEAGVNGLTHEVLLAILIDRLEGFQSGAFANVYNAAALTHLQSALGCLMDRTRERLARGVEGTNQV
jgi:hypothetical protein